MQKVISQYDKYFSVLVCTITILSVNQWSTIPIKLWDGINWCIDLLPFAITIFYYRKRYKREYRAIYEEPWFAKLYFLWVLICFIRGLFNAPEYWMLRYNYANTFKLLLPLLLISFYEPKTVAYVLRGWFKWMLPIFVLYALFFIERDTYGFYLGPVFFMGVFLPILPRRWKITIVILLLLMVTTFSNRSTMMKATMCFLMSITYIYSNYVTDKMLRIAYVVCLALPIVFFILAATDNFNIFEISNYTDTSNFDRIHKKDYNGSISDDTRTFLYNENINSAIKNNYVICGRTPSRGHDSNIFDEANLLNYGTKYTERVDGDEWWVANLFTWTGMIGLLLYSLFYWVAAFKAIWHSKNLWVKLMGVYVTFRWAYGWVEDFNRIDIQNISLWMMIAVCYSPLFRNMTDNEFKIWVKKALPKI